MTVVTGRLTSIEFNGVSVMESVLTPEIFRAMLEEIAKPPKALIDFFSRCAKCGTYREVGTLYYKAAWRHGPEQFRCINRKGCGRRRRKRNRKAKR